MTTTDRPIDVLHVDDEPALADLASIPGYSTSDGGTGFGLSIVERIAGAHGWEITVREGADGGARFEVTGVGFADE